MTLSTSPGRISLIQHPDTVMNRVSSFWICKMLLGLTSMRSNIHDLGEGLGLGAATSTGHMSTVWNHVEDLVQ